MQGARAENLSRLPFLTHQFLGRKGGTSPKPWDSLNTSYDVGDVKTRVDENRARICASMGMPKLYTVKQVHGTENVRVLASNSPQEILLVEADALWTTEKNMLLGVQSADCAPVLFASQGGEVVGAIHAGWRGAVDEIVPETLKSIGEEIGLKPHHFRVAIGPCAGFDAYEVGEEVVLQVQKKVDSKDIIKPSQNGKYMFDLAGFILKQLEQSHFIHVEMIRQCTIKNPADYFSARASHGKCGRQISVIAKNM